jgi:hypothetical protein
MGPGRPRDQVGGDQAPKGHLRHPTAPQRHPSNRCSAVRPGIGLASPAGLPGSNVPDCSTYSTDRRTGFWHPGTLETKTPPAGVLPNRVQPAGVGAEMVTLLRRSPGSLWLGGQGLRWSSASGGSPPRVGGHRADGRAMIRLSGRARPGPEPREWPSTSPRAHRESPRTRRSASGPCGRGASRARPRWRT